MLSFHNKQEVKDFYLDRVKMHQKLDEIHKSEYVNEKEKRYCAVGCTLHSSDHGAYEKELGIPRILAILEDGIFEGLPLERAKMWPEEFLSAIKVGVDLSEIWSKFAIWLLIDKDYGVIKYAKNDDKKNVIQLIADYYSHHKEITKQKWKDVYIYAAAAAAAAYAAAADAAAYAAAAAAAAYAAAAYAADDAREKHRLAQADKLLELLKDCK